MRRTISLSGDFFCDGHCYLLTSASLGGERLDGERDECDELADDRFDEDEYGERVLKVEAKYREYDGAAYLVRAVPLGGKPPPLPEIERGWFQRFEFRAGKS